MYNIEEIKNNLKENLTEYRYIHSLNVAETSKCLAKIHGINEEKAYLTGLVHDIAKEFSDEENEYYITKYNLPRFEEEYQRIVHSFVGAVYLKEKYNMDDEICKAVMSHTIANDNMTTLDKILFVADKIEPGKVYPGIEDERKIAKENLDNAMLVCLENNYKKLTSKGKTMYPSSLKVMKQLRKNK